jgi:16S rRNA (adenine1518-N6/adenine1519-N6)-dimethyltransferase
MPKPIFVDEWDESTGEPRPKHRLGQNFLKDPAALITIAEAVPIAGMKVLEVGAGHGELTGELSEKVGKGGSVTALELDADLIDGLKVLAVNLGNVKIVCVDALKFNFAGYAAIFGNLPYYISTPLLLKMAESDCKHAVVLLQEEFGKRVVAQPGSPDYGRLSVTLQTTFKAELIDFVPRTSFDPAPRVDSVLVKLTRLDSKVSYDSNLLRIAFCHKNKSVAKAFEHARAELGLEKKEVRKLFSSKLSKWAGLKVKALGPSDWHEFSKDWAKLKKG